MEFKEFLDKVLEKVYITGLFIHDLIIYEELNSIIENSLDDYDLLKEMVIEKYSKIHDRTVENYLKSENVNVWNLGMVSIIAVLMEEYLEDLGVNHSFSKWDIIFSADSEFTTIEEALEIFKGTIDINELDEKTKLFISLFNLAPYKNWPKRL